MAKLFREMYAILESSRRCRRCPVKSLHEWLGEGEELYNSLISELERVQQQVNELQQTIATKKVEVNQIAHVIGKPGVDRPPALPTRGAANTPVKLL